MEEPRPITSFLLFPFWHRKLKARALQISEPIGRFMRPPRTRIDATVFSGQLFGSLRQ
jgi:hypothetical protein